MSEPVLGLHGAPTDHVLFFNICFPSTISDYVLLVVSRSMHNEVKDMYIKAVQMNTSSIDPDVQVSSLIN